MKIIIETQYDVKHVSFHVEPDELTPEDEKGETILVGITHFLASMLAFNQKHNPEFKMDDAIAHICKGILATLPIYEKPETLQ